jgi:hypothetical protein
MGFVATKSQKEMSQINSKVFRLTLKIPGVEIYYCVRIFAECCVVVDVSKDQTLIKPANKLVKKELCHMRCDVFSFKSRFLNKPSHFYIVV